MTKQKITKRTIGSDPEYGIINKATGEAISSVDLIGGTKEDPIPIGLGCSKQEDNVGVEFCIPPCRSYSQFLRYITYCRNRGNEIVKEHNPNYQLIAASSLKYNAYQLATPEAMSFGCSPSLCAWTETTSPRPSPDDIGDLRSFGFHLHVGFPGKMIMSDVVSFIKLCDLHLGVPSIIVDMDDDRRKIYGNAGDFRVRDNGELVIIEYRTLGANLLGSKDTILWALRGFDRAIMHFNSGDYADVIDNFDIKDAIDNSDRELAKSLINLYDIEMPKLRIINEGIIKYATTTS